MEMEMEMDLNTPWPMRMSPGLPSLLASGSFPDRCRLVGENLYVTGKKQAGQRLQGRQVDRASSLPLRFQNCLCDSTYAFELGFRMKLHL